LIDRHDQRRRSRQITNSASLKCLRLSASAVDDSGALADVDFETGGSSGNGFGSGPTSPAQFNTAYGDLEMQPHNVVHSDLGGLMGVVDTAAQDPIFWLHHGNIDRLWNKWIQEGGGRTDPNDAAWLNTTFTFYDEAGQAVYLTGAEVVDSVGQLNYRYDDDPPPPMFIHFPIILAESAALSGEQRITLGASPVTVHLPLNEQARQALSTLPRQPDRKVFLRIQDIRTDKPPSYHYAIYLNPPSDQKVGEHAPGFVGNLSLFSIAPIGCRTACPCRVVRYRLTTTSLDSPTSSSGIRRSFRSSSCRAASLDPTASRRRCPTRPLAPRAAWRSSNVRRPGCLRVGRAKARRGELGGPLPMEYLAHGRVAFDPDEKARATIRSLFGLS